MSADNLEPLREEAKLGAPANESVAINKVYISFAVATAEQLLIREQVGVVGGCDVDQCRGV